jgi:dihydropteroate synthase
VKDTFFPKKKVLNVRGKIWILDSPVVMGILNLTADSFYDGGKYNSVDLALENATQMYEQGAKIIDIGAFSSRPGAHLITEEEEWEKLRDVISAIKKEHPHKFISVDTYRSTIAKRSLELGADIINDISAAQMDPQILDVAAHNKAPYIAMHMKGTPETMKELASYEHLEHELLNYFVELGKKANAAGLVDVLIDPGFGFAKNTEQNYNLLAELGVLKVLNRVVVVGVSRKSMIYKTLKGDATTALNGTTALHMAALMNGADILRVHDVKEALESITLYNKMTK